MAGRTEDLFGRLFTRDRAIFLLGLGGAVNEFFVRAGPERPYVIGASMVMLGLPAFIKWDKRSDSSDKQE